MLLSDNDRTDLTEALGRLDLDEHDAALVHNWLCGDEDKRGQGFTGSAERAIGDPRRPADDDPQAIRTVGVIGGGTAGYLTALALRTKRPWLKVALVESATIPIIGVGEATVPQMVPFLHHYLGIDPHELYQKVRPTWKLGIKFDWGPKPAGFNAPFDWAANSVGVLGSLAETGNINDFTVQSMLMSAGKAPVFGTPEAPTSLMKYLPYAYHLDNARFVGFLTELARERGVEHIEATLADVVLSGPEQVDHVTTTDGRTLEFDFYVDCTGFRSMLLEKAMGTEFHSFADSLFTDSAVTGNIAHGGKLKPYTTATTMDAGWQWTIATPESDHLGYVFSSQALSKQDAAEELARKVPGISEPRFVRFRVGRHAKAWRGNMMAVGNSYGFVEPLESSGLLMITEAILAMMRALPASWADAADGRELVNSILAKKWDEIRWFLSVHYKFNTRLDTPFWRDVRANVDVSGLQPLLDVYASGAPLRFRDPGTRTALRLTAPTFYELSGIDCILLGQHVPTKLMRSAEPIDRWRARRATAQLLVDKALPHHEALARFAGEPGLHDELIKDRDSWVVRAAANL